MGAKPGTDRLLPSVRWGLSAALAYLVLFDQQDAPGASELLFVSLLLASNLLTARLERWFSREHAFAILLGADSALVLLGLMLADSASQDLIISYFVCVILASMADSEERLIGLAILATGLYAFIGIRSGEDFWRASVLLRFPLLLFVTLSYGLLVTRLRAEQAARAAAEHRALGLEALLGLTREIAFTLSTPEIVERTRAAIARALSARECRVIELAGKAMEIDALASQAIVEARPIVRQLPGGKETRVVLPLTNGIGPFGAIVAEIERTKSQIPASQLEFCEIAADAAGLALANARQFEEITHLERTKTDFLRNLSHEMNTPLHAILGFADVAIAAIEEPDRAPARRALGRIVERAEEMSVHVDHLLRLSQLTLGQERTAPAVVDLREILARSVGDARRFAPAGASLDFRVAPNLERVIVDGEKLEQIVDCLLLNAVKFSEHGKIELAAALEDDKRLRLSIRDEGIGIADPERHRIFDDFQQADGSSTRRFPGLGLGLSVARRLVELLGGEIRVASEVGKGSTFDVLLPVNVPATA